MDKIVEKERLFKELYDISFVLKNAIEKADVKLVEKMMEERRNTMSAIDALEAPAIDQAEDSEHYKRIKELIVRIAIIEDANLEALPKLIKALEEKLISKNNQQVDMKKAKKAFNQYNNSALMNNSKRFDTRK